MQKKETDILESRRRRQSDSIESRYTCILYLRSDPTLFNKFMEDLDNVCSVLSILQARKKKISQKQTNKQTIKHTNSKDKLNCACTYVHDSVFKLQ